LRVRDAPVDDYDRLLIRVHQKDKPQDIRWGDYIHLSLDQIHWVSCQLEQSGATGIGKIYINPHLRTILNRDAVGAHIYEMNAPYDFSIRKASSWKRAFYTISFHPDGATRARLRRRISGIFFGIAVVIAAAAAAYWYFPQG